MYAALARAGFKRQRLYLGSLIAGIAASGFFGVFRSAIFSTLAPHRRVDGLGLAQTLTYVWMVQVLFGVIFSPWFWEWPDAVRSGDFLAELLRPGDVFGRLAAVDLGRSVFVLVTRGLPLLVVAAFFVHLALPAGMAGWAALAVSFGLTCVAAFEYRFVFGCMAFYTADYRAWWGFSFGLVWLGAGLVVPVEFLPQPFRDLTEYGPLAMLLVAPYRIAIGHQVAVTLALQAGWVAAGGVGGRALLARATRDLVVHGG